MKKIKLVIIGAGSSYMPELLEGIISNRIFAVYEIALVDIESGMKNASIILQLTKRMLKKANNPAKVYLTLNRREALLNADFVVTQVRVGGLDARIKDEKIPLRYNLIGQETTGAGGFANALRTVPVMVDIAHEMEEICPKAYLINFANPSGMVTQAVHMYSKINCVGLCNLPINIEREFCEYFNKKPEEIYVKMAGLNHLSFVTDVLIDGVSRMNELFECGYFTKGLAHQTMEVPSAYELINSLRLIPTSYLQYFWFEQEKLSQMKADLEQGLGTRGEQVKQVEKELFELYSDETVDEKPALLEKRGGALYSTAALNLISALLNPIPSMQIVNTLNKGAVPNLPYDAIIETNAHISNNGIHAIATDPLPPSVAPLVNLMKEYEIFACKAAMTGDRELAYLALVNHPLVHGHQNAVRLVDDIIRENIEFLPNFQRISE